HLSPYTTLFRSTPRTGPETRAGTTSPELRYQLRGPAVPSEATRQLTTTYHLILFHEHTDHKNPVLSVLPKFEHHTTLLMEHATCRTSSILQDNGLMASNGPADPSRWHQQNKSEQSTTLHTKMAPTFLL